MRLRIGLGVWIVAGLALALKIRLLQGLVGEETLQGEALHRALAGVQAVDLAPSPNGAAPRSSRKRLS